MQQTSENGLGWAPKVHGGLDDINLTGEFDLPFDSRLRFVYFIAFLPRSGSNLLASKMWQTGLLGAPCEYFNFAHAVPFLTNRFQTKSLEEYIFKVLQHRTSPNGVFGTKLSRRHLEFLQLIEFEHPIRPNRWIYVDRRDKCAQAVSLYIANQTDAWSSLLPERRRNVEYRFERIHRCYRLLNNEQKRWETFFERTGTNPLKIYYEDFVANPDAVVRPLLTDWRVPMNPHHDPLVPRYEKQGTARNSEWAASFRTELADRERRGGPGI